MSIVVAQNSQALQSFLNDRKLDRASRGRVRLYIHNGQLEYNENAGCMTLFAARLGFGNASMCKISKFIRKNQDTCFGKTENISAFNDYIAAYNDRHISFKRAKTVVEYQSYLDLAPKAFIKKIMNSHLYTSEEKNRLSSIANDVYEYEGKPIGPKNWTYANTTRDYLDALSIKYPQFRTLPILEDQIEDKDFNDAKIDEILEVLPKNLERDPSIFGHAFRINGNHRTSFVIDLENGLVEYYNSFGSDITAQSPLSKLADALSKKYNQPFVYNHATAGIHLQLDGYQCGIWACKFIKERIKQGKNFKPRHCSDYKIDRYRKKVFNKVFKYNVYRAIGTERLHHYLKHSLPPSPLADNFEPTQTCIFYGKQASYERKYFYNIKTEYYNWCKTGKMPSTLLSAIDEIQKDACFSKESALLRNSPHSITRKFIYSNASCPLSQ